jgi:hypothetical protein
MFSGSAAQPLIVSAALPLNKSSAAPRRSYVFLRRISKGFKGLLKIHMNFERIPEMLNDFRRFCEISMFSLNSFKNFVNCLTNSQDFKGCYVLAPT